MLADRARSRIQRTGRGARGPLAPLGPRRPPRDPRAKFWVPPGRPQPRVNGQWPVIHRRGRFAGWAMYESYSQYLRGRGDRRRRLHETGELWRSMALVEIGGRRVQVVYRGSTARRGWAISQQRPDCRAGSPARKSAPTDADRSRGAGSTGHGTRNRACRGPGRCPIWRSGRRWPTSIAHPRGMTMARKKKAPAPAPKDRLPLPKRNGPRRGTACFRMIVEREEAKRLIIAYDAAVVSDRGSTVTVSFDGEAYRAYIAGEQGGADAGAGDSGAAGGDGA